MKPPGGKSEAWQEGFRVGVVAAVGAITGLAMVASCGERIRAGEPATPQEAKGFADACKGARTAMEACDEGAADPDALLGECSSKQFEGWAENDAGLTCLSAYQVWAVCVGNKACGDPASACEGKESKMAVTCSEQVRAIDPPPEFGGRAAAACRSLDARRAVCGPGVLPIPELARCENAERVWGACTDDYIEYAICASLLSCTHIDELDGCDLQQAALEACMVAQGVGRESTEAECQDEEDNDGDGAVDCADPGCAATAACDLALPIPAGCEESDTGAVCVSEEDQGSFCRWESGAYAGDFSDDCAYAGQSCPASGLLGACTQLGESTWWCAPRCSEPDMTLEELIGEHEELGLGSSVEQCNGFMWASERKGDAIERKWQAPAVALRSDQTTSVFAYTEHIVSTGPFPNTGVTGEFELRVELPPLPLEAGDEVEAQAAVCAWDEATGGWNDCTIGSGTAVIEKTFWVPSAWADGHWCMGYVSASVSIEVFGGETTIAIDLVAPVLTPSFPPTIEEDSGD